VLSSSKFKPHKGLQKRVKITGRGKVKYKGSYTGHLRSHKSGTELRQLRRQKCAKAADIKRLEKMLNRHLVRGDA